MRLTKSLILTAALAAGTLAATANDKTESAAGSKDMNASKISSVRLSKLMDAEIQSNTGENLGKLEDLLVDPKTGEITFAVLGRGGFLGLGEKLVPVPWKAINVQSEKEFTLNVDKNKLKTAPTTDKEYSNLFDPNYTVTIYRFYEIPQTEMGGATSPGGVQQGSSSTDQNQSSTNSSSATAPDHSKTEGQK